MVKKKKTYGGGLNKKQDPHISCLQDINFRAKDPHRLKMERQKKIYHANRNKKKVEVQDLYQTKQTLTQRL